MRRLIPLTGILFAVVLSALLYHDTPTANSMSASRSTTVTTITTDTINISTYSYAPHLFTQTNTTYNISYPVLNWGAYQGSHPTKTNKAFTRLTLENDYLRVSLLPELGGRIYEMIFKPTGHNELYQNSVLKPTHWGPTEQGWWLAAGGIEWGLPVDEHGYESGVAWSYSIAQGGDGITVTLRDSTASDRLRARVDVFLPNDRAVLIVRPTIENTRGVGLDYKWWDNAMLAPGAANSVSSELRFVFPIDMMSVHSTNDVRLPGHGFPGPTGPTALITWPNYNGVDWSRLGNFDEWFGFFGYPQSQKEFAGVYDTSVDEGVVRVFPHTIATGVKGFAMGWAHPIGSGEWTDDGSYYVELHGGVAPTFWDTTHLNAGQSISWQETWYPAAGLGNAFSVANEEAALAIAQDGSNLELGVFATRLRTATQLGVWQRSTCQLLAQIDIASIDPATPQQFDVPSSIALNDLTILFRDGNSLIIGYNEKDCVAPTSNANTLPSVSTSTSFNVSWSGSDFYSGIASYDVQVKDGYTGAWTTWLSATTASNTTYNGTDGHTYFFRTRARDPQDNLETYDNDEWGDAFTSVLLSPAAVMETSRKIVPPIFSQGQSISYTIDLRNSGNLNGNITLTDTLPPSMTLIGSANASSGPAPSFDGSRITWSGSINASLQLSITYALTPTIDLAFFVPQTNTVQIAGGITSITRTATTKMAHIVYLPIIHR